MYGRGEGNGHGKTSGAGTKVQVHVQATPYEQALKVDKCPFSENSLKEVLIELGSKLLVQ